VTVNVAGSTECATAAFDSCNVTEAPAYQGASTDGSKVFFTSEQPLVEHDTDSTNNLYECRLPGGLGQTPDPVTPVNPVSGTGEGVGRGFRRGRRKCRASCRSLRTGRTCTSSRRAC